MKRKGFTLIELLVVIAILALLMGILIPALNKARQLAIKLLCGTNLKGIGQAMATYSVDYEDIFPRAGGPGRVWSTLGTLGPSKWYKEEMSEAFKFGPTVTSSMYLLVKYYKVPPKLFNCKGDDDILEFNTHTSMIGPISGSLLDWWDFGGGATLGPKQWPMPGESCSYAYHLPYVPEAEAVSFQIMDMSHPGSPVCADRNPFLDKNAQTVIPSPADYPTFNGVCHEGKGQNVLYKNMSVVFEKVPTVGYNEDNIYTYASGDLGDPIGTKPLGNGDGAPNNDKDAYLVVDKNGRWAGP